MDFKAKMYQLHGQREVETIIQNKRGITAVRLKPGRRDLSTILVLDLAFQCELERTSPQCLTAISKVGRQLLTSWTIHDKEKTNITNKGRITFSEELITQVQIRFTLNLSNTRITSKIRNVAFCDC
jgi:hypothetical protein